jgi:hypothetical protein
MAYTSRDRDRGRLAVAAVTGLGAAGALTATGWLAGVAASQTAQDTVPTGDDSASTTTQAGNRPAGRQLLRRPYVTRVTLRYVPAVGTPVGPAAGGSVTSAGPAAPVSSSSGSSGSSSYGSSSSSGSSGSSGSSAPAAPSSGS